MLFYKVEGKLIPEADKKEESRHSRRDDSRKILEKSETFHKMRKQDSFCFVSELSDDSLTAGIITDCAEQSESVMQAFAKHIGCPLQNMVLTEITINGMEQLLRKACRHDFIEDDDAVTEKYGIDRLLRSRGDSIRFGENMIAESCQKTVFQNAKKHLLDNTFLPELERIYAGATAAKAQGHPVHYLFQVDNRDTRRDVCRLLLEALYANNRLSSKRYCFLDFYPGEKFSTATYELLYKVSAGGAVVIRYLHNEDSENDRSHGREIDTITKICNVAKRYRNQVLTILCLPRECAATKKVFYENLGGMPFVEIREEPIHSELSGKYLKRLAREHHIRADKALIASIHPEKEYLASELNDIFDSWYGKKLQTDIYPQYKDLPLAGTETIKATPKGAAYNELQDMVGLKEAKAVIQKALNYFKMQHLYEERGMKRDNPAMHMAFTGNPGTAKTTVARLFAQIMRDNGLLSRGQLVEVGRGDLVGKYVGWTAQTVQAKFREAAGGVLFIDEAYSLMDGHSGSYGDEAINTIVQEMENHREDVVVILAGYPNEMEQFLQRNPGLRSRIAFHVPFADYTATELCEIATMMSNHKGFCLEQPALEKLKSAFEAAQQHSDFGNGRYVRNLLEQAKMNQASRLLEWDFADITNEAIQTIKAEDIIVPEIKHTQKRAIGFVCN